MVQNAVKDKMCGRRTQGMLGFYFPSPTRFTRYFPSPTRFTRRVYYYFKIGINASILRTHRKFCTFDIIPGM